MKHSVSQHKLDGGSKLLYIHTPGSSSTTITLNMNSGYRYVPYELYEMPHVAEHIFFESNQKYPDALELNRAIKRNGAYANAHTSFDHNWYDLVVSSDEVLPTLDLFGDFINFPDFSQSAIDKEIKVIADELGRNRENYGRLASFSRVVASRPGILKSWDDRIADFDKITSDVMTKFYRDMYTHENSVWVIGGAVAPDLVVDKLNRIMEPYGHGDAYVPQRLARHETPPIIYQERKLDQVYMTLVFELDAHYDKAEIPTLDIMGTLMSTSDIGDLAVQVRKRGLAYGIGTSNWSTVDDSAFGFSISCSRANIEAVMQLIVDHINRFKRGEVTDDDLNRAKSFIIGTWNRGYDTPGSLVGAYRGEFVEDGEITPIDRRIELFRAVTCEDVRRLSRMYFNPAIGTISLVGNLDTEERSKLRGIVDEIV